MLTSIMYHRIENVRQDVPVKKSIEQEKKTDEPAKK